MYLIDTVVLSELSKRERHVGIVRWLHDKAVDTLFLSAITIGEIERGMLRQRVRNPVFAEALAAWLDRTVETLANAFSLSTRASRVVGDGSARGSATAAPIF